MLKPLLLLAPLALSGCTIFSTPPTTATQTITAVAQAAAAIADAENVTPPSGIMSASVEAKATVAVSAAWNVFDASLTGIDTLVAAKGITPGSPTALAIKNAIVAVQAGLNAATAAVAIGDSASYTSALAQAQTALASISAALK